MTEQDRKLNTQKDNEGVRTRRQTQVPTGPHYTHETGKEGKQSTLTQDRGLSK